MTDLIAKRDTLIHRLTVGWAKINKVDAAGGDITTMEDHWIGLLRQYEALCDRITKEES